MPLCTVLITTKNRKDELANAIRSVIAQTVKCEILVIDDGSSDGTSEMVSSSFPQVRLIAHEKSAGYIVRRNEGARLANGSIIISIDDDAIFANISTIDSTLKEFSDDRIGAVAIPFIDVLQGTEIKQQAPSPDHVYIAHAFIGTAHAIRKDVFLEIGGYREEFFHQGEEGDFCLRMLNCGKVVRCGNASPIHHMESPKRDKSRMDIYGRRNDILIAWFNTPTLWLIPHVLTTTINGVRHAYNTRRFRTNLLGLFRGFRDVFKYWALRDPVSSESYLLFRRLKKMKVSNFDTFAKDLSENSKHKSF